MNYIRSTFADARLKYRVNRAVTGAVNHCNPSRLAECVSLADVYPKMILSAMGDNLSYSQPERTYGCLVLLEHLVGSCNYGFHTALAQSTPVQEKLVQFAMRRVEEEPHRRVQRLARLTLLEWSRIFVDDAALARLSRLATLFERRTRRSLLRAINVQNRRVCFRPVAPADVVILSPAATTEQSVDQDMKDVPTVELSCAEVWLCHVCGYMNSPAALQCTACDSVHTERTVPTSALPSPHHIPTFTVEDEEEQERSQQFQLEELDMLDANGKGESAVVANGKHSGMHSEVPEADGVSGNVNQPEQQDSNTAGSSTTHLVDSNSSRCSTSPPTVKETGLILDNGAEQQLIHNQAETRLEADEAATPTSPS